MHLLLRSATIRNRTRCKLLKEMEGDRRIPYPPPRHFSGSRVGPEVLIRSWFIGARSYVSAIALTAYARPGDRVRALRAGFDEYLAKPVEPAEFVDMIARLAEKGLG